jgi:hypothetical protein
MSHVIRNRVIMKDQSGLHTFSFYWSSREKMREDLDALYEHL